VQCRLGTSAGTMRISRTAYHQTLKFEGQNPCYRYGWLEPLPGQIGDMAVSGCMARLLVRNVSGKSGLQTVRILDMVGRRRCGCAPVGISCPGARCSRKHKQASLADTVALWTELASCPRIDRARDTWRCVGEGSGRPIGSLQTLRTKCVTFQRLGRPSHVSSTARQPCSRLRLELHAEHCQEFINGL